MKIDNKSKVIEYINNLKDYKGYVQFSHRPIDKSKDIFVDSNIKVDDEDGFIYEAHFCNNKDSISIKQINNYWLISTTDISNIDRNDTQNYKSDIENFDYDIKMAQIWEECEDEYCENMKVRKITKVVFAGFEKGDMK
jgi:CRISPR type III-associated protein (TIGR04423 family)